MVNLRFTLVCILQIVINYCVASSYVGDSVPVLLWGGSNTLNFEGVNPLLKTSRAEFKNFIDKISQQQEPILVFVKENFCVEDVTQHAEVFTQFIEGIKYEFFYGVESPLNVFDKLPSYNQTFKDEIADGRLAFVPIGDVDAIPETYKDIKEASPNTIAVLTGTSCRFNKPDRIRRAAPVKEESNSTWFVNSKRVLFHAANVTLIPGKDEEMIVLSKPTDYVNPKGEPILRMIFTAEARTLHKFSLELNFTSNTAGYYSLKSITYKPNDTQELRKELRTFSDISFPRNFSYHCQQNIMFFNESISLNITNLQVQIDATKFGDAYDCVGFMSIPIWAGIFVTTILALIMIWALSMIIDIRTMDRFDDPKGKTITVSGQE